jgi:xylulokinase
MNEAEVDVVNLPQELDLVLSCRAGAVSLDVNDHGTGSKISQWERTWGAFGADEAPLTEVDPHLWWNGFGECWHEALSVHGASQVLSLVIHGGHDVLICVDSDGEVIRPALCGADPRMEPDAKWLLSQMPGAGADWERLAGLLPTSAHMVSKCSWLHRSEPENWAQIDRLTPLSAWMGSRLTGTAPAVTTAAAQATGFWSLANGEYSQEICRIIDADRDVRNFLPKVVTATETTTGDAAVIGEWNAITVLCA